MAELYDMDDEWDDAGVSFDAIKLSVADVNSSLTSKLINILVNGSEKFVVDKTGALSVGNISKTVENLGLDNKVDDTDSRLTDARTPTAHTHTTSQITDFNGADYATAAQGAKADSALQLSSIVDNLTSTLSTSALSAKQGKVLKDLIDNLNILLTSNDTTLDTLQELVDFIKLNKTTLDSLTIANIVGLQNALDGKVGTSDSRLTNARTPTAHTHNDLYYTETEMTTGALTLANKQLSNSVIPADYSINQAAYDKNAIVNAHRKPGGSVICVIDGTPYVLSEVNKDALLNGRNDFATINLSGKPTTMEFIVDNGSAIPHYSRAFWQVGISCRGAYDNTSYTYPTAVQVLSSRDGVDWAEPENGEWASEDLLADSSVGATVWLSRPGQPMFGGIASSTPRYVKYILTNWHYNEAYSSRDIFWPAQLLFRHQLEEAYGQYTKKAGDEFLGPMKFHSSLLDQNGSKGTNTQLLSSTGTTTKWIDSRLKSPILTYDGNNLTSVSYSNGSKTITYSGDNVSSITTNFNGVTTTKTFNYTNGNLTSITES